MKLKENKCTADIKSTPARWTFYLASPQDIAPSFYKLQRDLLTNSAVPGGSSRRTTVPASVAAGAAKPPKMPAAMGGLYAPSPSSTSVLLLSPSRQQFVLSQFSPGRAMAVGFTSGNRHAADEEARAEVDVLNSRLEKTTQLTKKIQASLGRLEATGKSVREVVGPLNGETKRLQTLTNSQFVPLRFLSRMSMCPFSAALAPSAMRQTGRPRPRYPVLVVDSLTDLLMARRRLSHRSDRTTPATGRQ